MPKLSKGPTAPAPVDGRVRWDSEDYPLTLTPRQKQAEALRRKWGDAAEPLEHAGRERYCVLRAQGAPITKAYCEVMGVPTNQGYGSGRKWEQKPEVQDRIHFLQHERARWLTQEGTIVVGKPWVRERLIEVYELSLAEEKINLNAALKALELVGKDLGMFVERHADVSDSLDHLSLDELRERALKLAGKLDDTRKGRKSKAQVEVLEAGAEMELLLPAPKEDDPPVH